MQSYYTFLSIAGYSLSLFALLQISFIEEDVNDLQQQLQDQGECFAGCLSSLSDAVIGNSTDFCSCVADWIQ